MRPLAVAATVGTVAILLMLVPATATHGVETCQTLAYGLITPLNPFSCDVEITCPATAVEACAYDLYEDSEAGGLVAMHAVVDGVTVTECGPMLGICSTLGHFTVAPGKTVLVHCQTGAATIAFMAELDCNPNPVHN